MRSEVRGQTHHGVQAVGQVSAEAPRGVALAAQVLDLLLGLVEHPHTLCVTLRQLVQL